MNNKFEFDLGLAMIVIILVALWLFAMFGCSTTCRKKTCCPMEGHGPCPICTEDLILKDIRNGKLVR